MLLSLSIAPLTLPLGISIASKKRLAISDGLIMDIMDHAVEVNRRDTFSLACRSQGTLVELGVAGHPYGELKTCGVYSAIFIILGRSY